MTCNIRYLEAKDGAHSWPYRRDWLAQTIGGRDPDLVGLQECARPQLEFLLSACPGYSWFGICDAPTSNRPTNAILWKSDRFQLLSPGGYWLSSSPHVTGSSSWDSACVRLANWVRLIDLSCGLEFRLINTHLDHMSAPARDNQARLLAEDALSFPSDYPQILTGDLNEERDKPGVSRLLQSGWVDTHRQVHGDGIDPRTFHGFQGDAYPGPEGKIDWVMVRGPLAAIQAEVVRHQEGERYASDHWFLCVDLKATVS